MAIPQAPEFTTEEYLALEGVAKTRHEFFAGHIVAMAGADLNHNKIVTNVTVALVSALASCTTVGSNQRVLCERAGEYFYPDVVVTCLEPKVIGPRPPSLTNPQIIIE